MKTNSLDDPRLQRAVLGRKRIRVRKVTGVPVKESVEYRILQLKKKLGIPAKAPQYQIMMFGEWRNMSLEDYKQAKAAGMNVRIL